MAEGGGFQGPDSGSKVGIGNHGAIRAKLGSGGREG